MVSDMWGDYREGENKLMYLYVWQRETALIKFLKLNRILTKILWLIWSVWNAFVKDRVAKGKIPWTKRQNADTVLKKN